MVPLFNGPSVTFSSLKVKLNRCSLISWASCRWGKSRRSRGELWRITPPVPSIRVASFDFVPVHLTLSSKFFSKIKILDEDSQISWRYRIIIASCYFFFFTFFLRVKNWEINEMLSRREAKNCRKRNCCRQEAIWGIILCKVFSYFVSDFDKLAMRIET